MEDKFTRNLIKLFRKSRSQNALQVLMVNHQAAIRFAASFNPDNIMDFDDKIQFGNEVLIKLINPGGFDLRRKVKFNNYLINLIKLRTIDEIRKIRRKKNGKIRVKVDLQEHHSTVQPDFSFEEREQLEILVKEIQNLPRNQQIIMGCLFHGMSQTEIAKQCGVTVSMISQIVSASKKKIRENIKNY